MAYDIGDSGWIASHYFEWTSYIYDAAGHVQYTASGGYSAATEPTWNDAGGATPDGPATLTWLDEGIGTAPRWLPNFQFPANAVIVDPNGHAQQITTASGDYTSGSTTPSWNDSGGTTSDGQLVWSDRGVAVPAPKTDFIEGAGWWFGQLLVRASGDYVFYYSGAQENGFSRVYYTSFNGSTFGSDVQLPGQTGLTEDVIPLSANIDSQSITHFLYQTYGDGPGVSDYHVGMDVARNFGSVQLITNADASVSSSAGTASSIITYQSGSTETLGFVINIYDSSDPNSNVSLRLFNASAALNPSWSNSVITTGLWGGPQDIYPDNTDLIPLSVALGSSNGSLVAVWAVSDNFDDDGHYSFYSSSAPANPGCSVRSMTSCC